MNKSESKYFNTAAKMDEALLALLEEKDFEFINVKEVCEKAKVNRSTFYLHYDNTYDLLEECVSYMQKRFMEYFDSDAESIIKRIDTSPLEELVLITPEYLKPYLKYVKDNQKVYYATLKSPKRFDAVNAYNAMFKYIFSPILARFNVPEDERRYVIDFFVNGISAILSRWVENGCKDDEEKIISIIEKYVLRSDEIKF